MRSPPPEKEGAAETMCDELTAPSIPHPGYAAEGGEIENLGVKLNLERGRGWGLDVLILGFISCYPILI